VQYDSIKTDTHGAWDAINYLYRVPVSGNYEIYGSFLLQFGATTAELVAGLWIDGVQVALQQNFKPAALNGNLGLTYNFLRTLNAGQTIQIRCYQVNIGGGAISGVFESAGIEHGALYINRLSGPSVVAASESVSLRATSATTLINSTGNTIIFSSKEYDSHSIYNTSTGAITIPISGKWSIKCITEAPGGATCGTANAGTYLMIYKGNPGSGSLNTLLSNLRWPLATATAMPVILSGGATVSANAGDVFYIAQGKDASISNYSLSGTATTNVLVIERVGN
jgi:hypothetical protein